jgi:hypothetical protein
MPPYNALSEATAAVDVSCLCVTKDLAALRNRPTEKMAQTSFVMRIENKGRLALLAAEASLR